MSAPEKLRLDLPLVLSGVDDAEDRCVARLTDALSGRPGIEEAHIVGGDGESPQLCVHYNPNEITLGRVRELVQSVGAQLGVRYAHLVFRSSGPLHARAARRAADGLRNVPGVLEADVAASGALRIEYDRSTVSEQTLLLVATSLGLAGHATLEPPRVHGAGAQAVAEKHTHDHDHNPAEGSAPGKADHGDHKDHGHGDDHEKPEVKAADGPAQEHAGHEHAEGGGDHAGHDHAHGGLFGEKSELIFALLAGALVALISFVPSKGLLYLALGLAPGLVWLPKSWLRLDAAKPVHAFTSGFTVTGLNLLAGVAGPLLDVFFVRTVLTRHAIVATKAATQVFAHLAKIVVYGAPLLATPSQDMPDWRIFAVAIPLSMCGAWVGGKILDRMSDVDFKSWTRWIVTGVGLVYLIQAAQLFMRGGG